MPLTQLDLALRCLSESKGPVGATELARRLHIPEPSARRVLRTAFKLGKCREPTRGKYELSKHHAVPRPDSGAPQNGQDPPNSPNLPEHDTLEIPPSSARSTEPTPDIQQPPYATPHEADEDLAAKLMSRMQNVPTNAPEGSPDSCKSSNKFNAGKLQCLFRGKYRELLRYPTIMTWMASNLAESTQLKQLYEFGLFLGHCRKVGQLETIDPDVLVEIQRRSSRNDDQRYLVWDKIVKPYLNDLPRTYNGKRQAYKAIRSFFACNRHPLPEDKQFRITSEIPPREPKLSLASMREIAQALAPHPKMQSMYLVKVQGLMGEAELDWVNRTSGREIYQQVVAGADLIRIDFQGRKKRRNEPGSRYYTFIGKDAIDSLCRYFEAERGEVREGEPLWVSGPNVRTPYRIEALACMVRRVVKKLFLPDTRGRSRSAYYGYNLHETRDVILSHARTLKSKDFDIDCARFFAGHVIDRNKYEKMYLPELQAWVKQQYEILLSILNLITSPEEALKEEKERAKELEELYRQSEQKNKELEERVKRLEGQYKTFLASVELKKLRSEGSEMSTVG